VWVAPSSASADTTPFILADHCVEHQAFLDGDPAAVAADLPRTYTPEQDPQTGRPLLFARAERCDVTIGDSTAPATLASFGIVIRSPDGTGCASAAPGVGQGHGDAIPYCNWYPLFWVANDRRVVDWLHADTPDFSAFYVPGLVLTEGARSPVTGTPFHFDAPSPSPSEFSMDDAGHPGPSKISVRGGYWVNTHEGVVKLTFATDDITPGSATGGVVRAQPGSEMARLMGADQQPYLAVYAAQIGAERWDHGSYRKQIESGDASPRTSSSFAARRAHQHVERGPHAVRRVHRSLHALGALDHQPAPVEVADHVVGRVENLRALRPTVAVMKIGAVVRHQ
jgi:hypothetical protein